MEYVKAQGSIFPVDLTKDISEIQFIYSNLTRAVDLEMKIEL